MATLLTMDISAPPAASPAQQTPSQRRRTSPNLSIDLSTLPPLIEPSPPSNTLLVTNLQAPEIFTASTLTALHNLLNEHAPVHTFSPLKSFRRIILTFYTTADAIRVRQLLDGEAVCGSRVRVYFGQETKISLSDEERYLQAPKSQKQFFISPPPSPPMGWEMRDEEPPNKEVHAEDLAAALAKLHARPAADEALKEDDRGRPEVDETIVSRRQRSGTGASQVVVYDPQDHGHSPGLPAIAVEDTSECLDGKEMEGFERTNRFVHTARPPVELMEQ
ncbi:hypothetical protein M433DRAFT_153585 [Acidomyces richmondensis BFW]|nr:MAG: hypothetical protein FE78DRAFT_89259 [Acidomyces sp. 'richmondensis']KYG46241.1 hypothetical protein M433DRAFT_153585 [Acidomyces richmondensis BFW]